MTVFSLGQHERKHERKHDSRHDEYIPTEYIHPLRLYCENGQRICRLGGEEMWDSVTIQCKEEAGALSVRILVCNPDWETPLQIAWIRSQPKIDSQTSGIDLLQFNLEHIGKMTRCIVVEKHVEKLDSRITDGANECERLSLTRRGRMHAV